MPELPEVEYVRRNLDRWARGHLVVSVSAKDPRIVRPTRPKAFESSLTGRTVQAVDRRGKWLRCLLDGGQRLFVHLGMTGWLEEDRDPDPANPHPAVGHYLRFERVGFVLRRGKKTRRIAFVDPRRWGRLVLAREDLPAWTALGPDPLDDGIDVARLGAKLARRNRSIKEALLDQTVLAGVGNIQAIEALWRAKIDPRSRASALSRRDLAALARGLRWTIERTLADLTTKRRDSEASPFKIYGRRGAPCPRCKALLQRIELGGRTTTFCKGCQERR